MILDLFNESNLFDDDDVFEESLEPEIENAEAIPLKEGENITDAYFRIAIENAQNYSNIMNTIAVSEMAYMEKNGGAAPVYEAVDVKRFGRTIVQYVQEAYGKVKALFESAINAIKKIFTRDLIAEYEQALKDKKIDPSKTITVQKGVKINDLGAIPDKVNVTLNQHMNTLTVDVSRISKDDASTKSKEWKENKKENLNKMRGAVIGAFGGATTGCTSKDFSSELAKAVSSKIEGDTEIKLSEAYEHVKNDISVKDLRKAFKNIQKCFNKILKEAKDIEKKAKDDKADAAITAGAMNVAIIKECINVLNATSHQIIKLAGKQASMYKGVLKKGLSGKKSSDKKDDKKKDDKKATNEGADLICDLI